MEGQHEFRVSVVIPHFDRISRLVETLNNLTLQTMRDFEVIVIDDASPVDPTSEIENNYFGLQVQVIRLPRNVGPSGARNAGIRAARGCYVAFLDSDDLWLPSKLEAQLALMDATPNPDKVLCGTKIQMQVKRRKDQIIPKRAKLVGESNASYLFMGGGSAQTSSLMLSRTAARKVMFDENLRQFEDYLFFIKSEAAGLQYEVVDKALTVWFNDWRHDRLSMHYNKTRVAAQAFVEAANSYLTKRERVAFLINRTGDSYITSDPHHALSDIVFGIKTGVFSLSRLSKLLARWVLLPILKRA